jgi:nicotinate-nucleotide adenylyltransferase
MDVSAPDGGGLFIYHNNAIEFHGRFIYKWFGKRVQVAKRVAIFGGSFNPPHIGHVAICEWIFAKNLADEIMVVPCLVHPFGKHLVSFEDRYAMCLFAFRDIGPKVVVSKIEKYLGGTSHTIRTIRHLINTNPDSKFSLVTGGDIQQQTKEWLDFGEIKKLVPIIAIPRGPKSPIPDISATETRRRVAAGESILDLVPKEVAVYIITHRLYRD